MPLPFATQPQTQQHPAPPANFFSSTNCMVTSPLPLLPSPPATCAGLRVNTADRAAYGTTHMQVRCQPGRIQVLLVCCMRSANAALTRQLPDCSATQCTARTRTCTTHQAASSNAHIPVLSWSLIGCEAVSAEARCRTWCCHLHRLLVTVTAKDVTSQIVKPSATSRC
jgi:hypothetical protein